MSRSRWFVLCLVVLCFSPCAVDAASAQEPGLWAGAARADITPQAWPVELVGQFNQRLAHRAWDPLHARAIVLKSDETTLALVVVDSCYVKRELMDEAKRRIAEQDAIPVEHILISATHTHTAPPARKWKENGETLEYSEHLIRGIVSAVHQAHANLEPARAAWGKALIPDELFNRRWFVQPEAVPVNPFGTRDDTVVMNPGNRNNSLIKPAGPTDPEFSILSVQARDGRPIAVLGNYSLHYVGGIPEGIASADYFGEYCRLLEARLDSPERKGPPFVAALSNGTSGDVNNINFLEPRGRSEPFERLRIVAGKCADRTFEVLETLEYKSDLTLAAAQRLLPLEFRRPTPAQVKLAQEYLAEPDPAKVPPRAHAYARWTLELNEPPHSEAIVLQALRIGELGVAAIPCETFTEIGLEIKDKSPLATTFTIELANGHYGYLPTPRQHELGGYETWLGTNRLELTASDKITATILELLAEIK